jgi:hypothetical protein
LGHEISLSLRETDPDNNAMVVLQNVRHATPRVAALFVPRIKAWLDEVLDAPCGDNDPIVTRIRQAVDTLLKSEAPETRNYLEATAIKRLKGHPELSRMRIWLPVLMQLDPAAGVETLAAALQSRSTGHGAPPPNAWLATLCDRNSLGAAIDPRRPEFTPELLLRLARLVYQHVRPEEDPSHEGVYSPTERDDAESLRDAVIGALFSTSGVAGWNAKLHMATDPLFAHLKDRVIAIARERAAEEVDGPALIEADILPLDTYGELPPTTRDAMFALLRDRLDDLEELLLQDISPRELWATITDERLMRREVTRELLNKRNNMYTVEQESVTADEKENDIRMRSTRSNQQAVIELKIGDKPRSAAELCDAITNQLVKKYMAAEECRAGCLLITLASDKKWTGPSNNGKLDFPALIANLNDEAHRLSVQMGGNIRLMVKGLDLRPPTGAPQSRVSREKPAPRNTRRNR